MSGKPGQGEAARIDLIYPDGTSVELPPTLTDPSVLFANEEGQTNEQGVSLG